MFISCFQDCMNGASAYDVQREIFQEMNRYSITPSG
jgi:hypothetical protein